MSADTRGAGTCRRCTKNYAWLWHVEHRTRHDNGHRALTARAPLCEPCALHLVATYNLVEEAELMGKSYFVEGWHAESLVVIHDYAGEHS